MVHWLRLFPPRAATVPSDLTSAARTDPPSGNLRVGEAVRQRWDVQHTIVRAAAAHGCAIAPEEHCEPTSTRH
eukprot:4038267-Pyramimonas_sp.AAC.2